MPKVSNLPFTSSVDLYSEETNPSTNIGQYIMTQDGKGFRYVLAGTTALVAGDLQQSQAESTDFDGMALQAAVAAGATTIPVTLGSTATTASLFDGGVLSISAGTGIGQVFTIKSHDVASGAATCNFEVEEKVLVALATADTKVTIRPNIFKKVIIFPTTATGVPVGGAIKAITASKYGWIQSHGVGAALSDATVTANDAQGLTYSAGTPGAVTQAVAANTEVARSIVVVNVSAKVYPVFWLID